MHARPVALIPPPGPAEMAFLVARAGLTLNAGQMADLVLAWRQLADLIAQIPRDRKLVADLPCEFSPKPPAAPHPRRAMRPKATRKPPRRRQ